MNSAIYTAIFNNYDSVKNPKYVDKDYDYILFLDKETYDSQERVINDSIFKVTIVSDFEDGFMKAKDIKVNPQKYLKEYDSSLYIDGSFQQLGSVSSFVNSSKMSFKMCSHPRRNCTYDESEICIKQMLDDAGIIESQINKYQQEGMPRNIGLFMGGIIYRVHNKKSSRINRFWWNEIQNGSRRDQLSIMYTLWSLKEKIGMYNSNEINRIFKLSNHIKI